jgi:IclR family pca regulon transcriptional regulator
VAKRGFPGESREARCKGLLTLLALPIRQVAAIHGRRKLDFCDHDGTTAIKKAETTSSRTKRRKMPPSRRTKVEFVEALARGLAVLGAFDEAHSEMALTEVANRIGVSPATARRSLHTLEALGYLRFVNKRYVLAAHVLTLGAAYIRAAHIDEALMPELRRLVDLFGDASSVSVLDGSNILYIAHCSEQRAARRTAGIGVTYPAYATSMGRVLISRLRDDELEIYLDDLRPIKFTENTVTDIGRLRRIFVQTRRLGYSAVVDELDYGITALAVPITDQTGRVVAAVNTSGYSGKLPIDQLVDGRLNDLRIAATRIGQIFTRYPVLLHSIAATSIPASEN